MDESAAQSPPEQQTPISASVSSATPKADSNNEGIISNYQLKRSTNSEPKEELQTHTPLELSVHPTYPETLATSQTEIPHTDLASVPLAVKQIKQVDNEIDGSVSEKQFTEKSVHEQQETKDFPTSLERIFSKNSEEQLLELPTSTTKASSAIPTEENPVEIVRKSENDFIFYKCRFCGLTYNYLTTLRAHERVHNIDEPYKCNRCSESFHYMCELEYHAKQHTDLKGYKCECGRTFHSYTDLLYHKHPGEEDEESISATAPIVAKSGPLIPENDFPVPEFIEKGFEPKHPLKVYSDVRLNPYICQYCSKSYPNSRMLAYHMYGHRGEKIFNPRASRYLMARNENSYISSGV